MTSQPQRISHTLQWMMSLTARNVKFILDHHKQTTMIKTLFRNNDDKNDDSG